MTQPKNINSGLQRQNTQAQNSLDVHLLRFGSLDVSTSRYKTIREKKQETDSGFFKFAPLLQEIQEKRKSK